MGFTKPLGPCLDLFCREISPRSAYWSALMDPASRLIHLALLIPSWLSHREDANRLFGTDPLKKLCCDVGCSYPGALHGQRNKQATCCDTLG